ncbi:hypothetical protein R9C00_03110 [Flammeovirgaceae bacterium SG7u.111]|nr:hypothetical protein [Flammeovirgaceae bacterium SG7u.132]WPO36431.1 hypothetical protein R9C00_03110 [Flammeovirgaceae bacterium SG7u.111]
MKDKNVLLSGRTSKVTLLKNFAFLGLLFSYFLSKLLLMLLDFSENAEIYFTIIFTAVVSSFLVATSYNEFELTTNSIFIKRLVEKQIKKSDITIIKIGYLGYRGNSQIIIHYIENESQQEMKNSIYVDSKQYKEVKSNCQKYGIEFYHVMK